MIQLNIRLGVKTGFFVLTITFLQYLEIDIFWHTKFLAIFG